MPGEPRTEVINDRDFTWLYAFSGIYYFTRFPLSGDACSLLSTLLYHFKLFQEALHVFVMSCMSVNVPWVEFMLSAYPAGALSSCMPMSIKHWIEDPSNFKQFHCLLQPLPSVVRGDILSHGAATSYNGCAGFRDLGRLCRMQPLSRHRSVCASQPKSGTSCRTMSVFEGT